MAVGRIQSSVVFSTPRLRLESRDAGTNRAAKHARLLWSDRWNKGKAVCLCQKSPVEFGINLVAVFI